MVAVKYEEPAASVMCILYKFAVIVVGVSILTHITFLIVYCPLLKLCVNSVRACPLKVT